MLPVDEACAPCAIRLMRVPGLKVEQVGPAHDCFKKIIFKYTPVKTLHARFEGRKQLHPLC